MKCHLGLNSRTEAFSPSPMGCLQDGYATYIKLAKLWGNYSHTDGQRLDNGLKNAERIQAKPVSDQEAKAIITHIIEFQTVLTNELQTFAAYQIGRKGIYSTSDLIEQADNIFGEKIHKNLAPETWKDISESGRCLAFDLATATAFHIWRAVERELRTYYEIWTGHPALKKAWATLLIGLKTTKADGKVIAVLDQLRDLHRNPTIHPASEIDIDDALALFGIASSAITSMVNDVPAVRLGLGSSVR